jgi:protein-S-isoprenylcysteine O-methyltransferase Ste14
MALKDKWINLFYKAATGSKKVRTLLTPIGATFFFLYTALFIFLALRLDRWVNFPQLLFKPWNTILSLPIILIALFLLLWTVWHFLRTKGTPVPFNPPPKLVNTGPYAHCRNPMLTGIFILLFGLGVYYRSVSLIFIFTPLYILIGILELKAIEEPEFTKRLGKDYLEYKMSTPMFIPHLRARSKKG